MSDDKLREHAGNIGAGFKKIGQEVRRPWVMLVLIGIAILVLYNVFQG